MSKPAAAPERVEHANAPELLYESPRVQVYARDCRHGLQQVFDRWHPTVLMSDPPYAHWKYISSVNEDPGAFNFKKDINWLASVALWYQEWFPNIRQMFAGRDKIAVLFLNPHYVGFSLRWATWMDWPLRGVLACAGDGQPHQQELLVIFGDGPPLSPDQADIIQTALTLNRYGNGKNIAMLQALLTTCPPGPVFDPFCGEGTTLEAAMHSGRFAIGFEIDRPTAERAAARALAVDAALTGTAPVRYTR